MARTYACAVSRRPGRRGAGRHRPGTPRRRHRRVRIQLAKQPRIARWRASEDPVPPYHRPGPGTAVAQRNREPSLLAPAAPTGSPRIRSRHTSHQMRRRLGQHRPFAHDGHGRLRCSGVRPRTGMSRCRHVSCSKVLLQNDQSLCSVAPQLSASGSTSHALLGFAGASGLAARPRLLSPASCFRRAVLAPLERGEF